MKTKYPVLVVRGGIFDDELAKISKLLSGKNGDRIYMLIDSPGGDPSIGYRIMRLLQAKYGEIITLVPGEAYSTATLMALGSDVIYMHESACLGPLDTQIKHPTDGTTISSLEIREVLNTLSGFLKTYGEEFYDSLKSNHSLGKKDAAELAMRTANELVKPIAEKIDPIYLQSSIRSLRLGQKYAETLLTTRMMKNQTELAKMVAIFLANHYDYHGYAITIDEATNLLALNVHKLSELPEWESSIKTIFENEMRRGIHLEEIQITVPDAIPPKVPAARKPSATGSANAKIEKDKGGTK